MNRLLTGMIQVIQEVDTNTGYAICNEHTCPTMSAGRCVFTTSIRPLSNALTSHSLTYTWLENGRPAKIPAPSYITRVQKWIVGKIHDPVTFPTDPPNSVSSTAFASGDTASPSNHSAGTALAAPPTSLSTPLTQLSGQETDWIGKQSGFPPNFHSDVRSIIKQMFRCYAHLYHGHWENPFWHINRHLELNSCFVHFVTVAMYYDLLSRKDMEPLQRLIEIFVSQGVIPGEAVQQHTS
jgi:Mob1/phocein family